MPPRPTVSVLIPSYNHGAYLAQTLLSVLTQTVRDLEVLVVDDGSVDHSPTIIREAARHDGRVRFWQQENKGLIATLNLLADRAQGEFVAQIDSDDMWTPERLAWGLEDMAADHDLAASFTTYLRIDGAGAPVPRADQLQVGALQHEALMARLTVKNTVCACTAFMRRSALQKIGPFARGFSLSHDWDRWLRLSLVGKLMKRDTIGAFYRHHDSNQSLDQATTRKQELAIHDELAETLIAHHGLDPAQQLAIYGRAAALAFDTQQPERLVAYLLKKSKIYPLFEHEQVWLLHAILQQKAAAPHEVPSFAAQTSRDLFTPENRQRLDHILAYRP